MHELAGQQLRRADPVELGAGAHVHQARLRIGGEQRGGLFRRQCTEVRQLAGLAARGGGIEQGFTGAR